MQPMRIMITGTNTITALTPGMTPSTSRLVSSPAGRRLAAKVERALKPSAIQSWGIFPRMKESEYTKARMAMKMGMPRARCVRSASSLAVGDFLSSGAVATSLTRPWAKP